MIDSDFVKQVEEAHFRTNEDTGAHLNTLFIWNMVRKHIGLKKLDMEDLPAYCATHKEYHVIRKDYGCVRKNEKRYSSSNRRGS